ncbi:putative MPP superfamily phosphohydrolase [Phycicoccus badiiscoriae]|uniref:Putative MPP superfamily phosphohydrolase n=1 Tax=Pedococcus badiiscoriae TaxID=642776 RepID=A0A852WD75_9MICO|nr:metallophosphoesterase [Pedococcus badiiscoriae]NYG06650.1 putative MPP superfamily phosphohydrolase [Pedococcus badiiscoriae]
MNTILGAAAGVAALGVGGVAYASLVERNWFALRRFDVPVLAPGAAPLRVLHISDLHLVPRQRRRIEWVRGLAALEPDLVVNTGDNLAALDAVPGALEAMEPLFAFPGVFVMGSNDYYAPVPKNPARYLTRGHAQAPPGRVDLPIEDLRAGMRDGGWVDLDNVRTKLTVRGAEVEFVGTDDAHLRKDRYAAVAGPASADVDLTVGVTHAPYQRVLDPMAADGAQLLIAGHTHGGQLVVPFYGALVTNCDLPTDRAKGVSRWWPGAGSTPSSAAPADAAWLHVSAGLGTSPYAPVRFACRPEATLLTLTPADA